ncbi:kinase-like domain-containing protein [Syncephalastrum racemosum]|uniref:Kinase-like domain-containing protein n=1 Tax=Syncephalastrum racemosum TaxID=13706 RepID=A0A1X2HMC8_SYNRA|nr:kinase-like domain-containing protein [Syncephalastrum racemosum]
MSHYPHSESKSRPASLSQQVLVQNLSDRLQAVDFNTPAKIFQSKRHNSQFENVTPDVSVPGTPGPHDEVDYFSSHASPLKGHGGEHHLPLTAAHTPPSLSPHESAEHPHHIDDDDEEEDVDDKQKNKAAEEQRPSPTLRPQPAARHSSSAVSTGGRTSPHVAFSNASSPGTPYSLSQPASPHHSDGEDDSGSSTTAPVPSASTSTSYPSRPTTPSQFVFKKPQYNSKYHQTHFHRLEKKGTILHDLKRFFKGDKKHKKKSSKNSVAGQHSSARSTVSDLSFANEFNKDIESRYGKWGRFVGKGAGGSVRLIRRSTDNKTFAVKQFRKRLPHENEKEYVKKVTAEFCIGSTLHNPNIIETLDIIQEQSAFYEIMEFAPNDLFNIVMSGKMTREEIACCWRQMLNGVEYLHETMGIAHRDLKLDNMMLDERGVVKLIDFGCSVVIKYPYESKVHRSKGVCGSDPYIAPEQYTQPEYDARLTDLWSCGIVFICMSIRRFPWRLPRPSQDQSFKNFVSKTAKGAERLFKLLPRESRPILSRILEPDPLKRCTLQDVLNDPWVAQIPMCTPETACDNHIHHLLVQPTSQEALDRGNRVIESNGPPSPAAEDEKQSRRK